MAEGSAIQLPNVSATGQNMTHLDLSDDQMEQRGKWAERIGVGPLLAIISLSIISAVLMACLVGFRLVAMEFIKPTFDDQRAAIRETAESAKGTAELVAKAVSAIEAVKGHGDAQTKTMESQTKAMWELKTNSDKNLRLHEKMIDRLESLLPNRPDAPPMPETEKP